MNLDKSSVVFSRNVTAEDKDQVLRVLGMRGASRLGKYLGLDVDIGLSKKGTFEFVTRKVEARLNGWAEQLLSQSGKEVLLTSVRQRK